MAEGIIIHLETSADICSVALAKEGSLVTEKQDPAPRSHARVLTKMIHKLLVEQGISAQKIEAVAVSSGPGSYTGLRIGVSAAKGMAMALDIPMIAIPTPEAMVAGIKQYLKDNKRSYKDLYFCPLIDARRMEVYMAMYNPAGNMLGKIEAKIVDENSFAGILENKRVLFFGSGAEKCSKVIRHPNASFETSFIPLARHLVSAAWRRFTEHDFVDTAYFEPFYLKDFIPTIPRKKLV